MTKHDAKELVELADPRLFTAPGWKTQKNENERTRRNNLSHTRLNSHGFADGFVCTHRPAGEKPVQAMTKHGARELVDPRLFTAPAWKTQNTTKTKGRAEAICHRIA